MNQARSRSDHGSPPPGPKQGPGSTSRSDFGTRVEEILVLAEEEAREIRGQADAAARAVRGRAEVEARELVEQARAEAVQLVAQARLEADRLFTAASEAAQLRVQSSEHELHRLSRLQDAINADLYRAKNVLDGLFAARPTDGGQDPQPARTV